MRPVVDIISDVITAMKPDIRGFSTAVGGATVTVGAIDASVINLLYVGERMKLTYSGGYVYGVIASIGVDSFVVTLETSQTGSPSAIEVVLNYEYGNYEIVVARFNEMSQNPTYKHEMFPAIVLFQPFEETVENDGDNRLVTLNLVILTDSSQDYSYADRYTYNFKVRLYPLEDLFVSRLKATDEFTVDFTAGYTRTDLPGKLLDKREPLFNDFIDCIEWKNLKLKIYNVC